MSSGNPPFQSPGMPNQGYPGGQPYGGYPGPQQMPPNKGGSATKIVLIVLGVVFLLGLLVCGVAAALLVPAVTAARSEAQRQMDAGHLKQVGLALHNYQTVYKRFPAAANFNDNGEELLSWRVSILPFIEYQHLYQQVDWSQPADSMANNFLVAEVPAPYSHPDSHNSSQGMTNVFAIVADEEQVKQDPSLQTAIAHKEYNRFRDMLDGLSNIIIAISLPNKSAPWAEPIDLTPEEAYDELQKAGSANVLFADGSVRKIEATAIPREKWLQACRMRDGWNL